MPIKILPLSFTTCGLLQTAAEARNIDVKPRLLDAAWEDSNTSYILIGETGDGLVRCDFSNADSQVRSWTDITERRMWTAPELHTFIGTKLNYNIFSSVKVSNTWTTTIGRDGTSVTGVDNSEPESLAKAIINYLNAGLPIR